MTFPPILIPAEKLEAAMRSIDTEIMMVKAAGYDLLRDHLRELIWSIHRGDVEPQPVEVEVKADGAEPPPVYAPDADPFAAPQPQPTAADAQPTPRRSGRRSRRTEEGQPTAADAQPTPDPTSAPQPDEGQPLTAEALGLAPEPAAQPLPLPVVEAPDLSAAPATTDDVYGTEPAEDPFA